MARKARAGATDWAVVLSELAETTVTVDYEDRAWRVRWTDGPTTVMLVERARQLSQHRVGAPLTAEKLWFERHTSPQAWALAWLDTGVPAEPVAQALATVEDTVTGWAYPERCPDPTRAAAGLLAMLAGGDAHRMGMLLADGHGPLPRLPTMTTVPRLPGVVTSLQWMRGGPPPELLGQGGSEQAPPTDEATSHETRHETPKCAHCAGPLPARTTGRPAHYCCGACRTAAARARRRASRPA